jgi:alcohol dehydrogenase class IV
MAARDAFQFDYDPATIRFGRGCVADLHEVLADRSGERALVVCGRTVGKTTAVMDPVRHGLGDHLAGVFAETTPEKTLGTGLRAVEQARETNADALVAVGGGSSLDVTTSAAALASHEDPGAAADRAVESRSLAIAEDRSPLPVVAVPTTLAGASLSAGAGVTFTLDRPETVDEAPGGGVRDRRLMPAALFADPALVATTPPGIRTASAMNGFNKAVEVLYSPHRTAITDATAIRGLELMRSGFATLPETEPDLDRLAAAVAGIILAQYGVSTPGAPKLGVLHAFGHGFSAHGVHQGTGHAVVTPHVLRALFEQVDGRRRLLAEGLDVETEGQSDPAVSEAVVDAVAGVREDLGLPVRIRDLPGIERSDLPDVAAIVADDRLLDATPTGFNLSKAEIGSVLEAAW